MSKNETNPKVDWFFAKDTPWQKEYAKLRAICLDCGLREELKWGCPCYIFENTNVVLIHGFKEYCALLFFKGALLQDPHGILFSKLKMCRLRGRPGSEMERKSPGWKKF